MAATARTLCALSLLVGCGNIDLGGYTDPPFLVLDEDVFHCVIQPQVIEAHGCAAEGCHLSQTALSLVQTPAAMCVDGIVQDPIPAGSLINYERVLPFVQSDPGSSPLWRAPTLQDSHPLLVFETDSLEANLIADWLLDGTGL